MKQWALLFLRDNASTFEQSERKEKLNEWRKKQGFGQKMSEKDICVGDFRYAGNPPGMNFRNFQFNGFLSKIEDTIHVEGHIFSGGVT